MKKQFNFTKKRQDNREPFIGNQNYVCGPGTNDVDCDGYSNNTERRINKTQADLAKLELDASSSGVSNRILRDINRIQNDLYQIESTPNNTNININTNNNINMCSALPTVQLQKLCAYRSNNDMRYKIWVQSGMAWWLGSYSENNPVTGGGWELNHYLPRWWWRYPEIPAPSIQWLSRGNRRRTHLPLPNDNIVILQRINLNNDIWDARLLKQVLNGQTNDIIDEYLSIYIDDNMYYSLFGNEQDILNSLPNVESIQYYNQQNVRGYTDPLEPFTDLSDNPNQSWNIIFITIVVIAIILFVIYYNKTK